MGYDEEFKKWMYKYYFRKGIFKYGLIGSLLAPVFILVFSTIDSFFLCSEDFYGLGFAGILCFLVIDLFIYGWGMIGAVVALKKDKVQTVLSGRPPEKQSIVIPSEDWKQGEIGELYNLANKKAKLAGMSVVIITILVISGLYIPRFYQSYCRKVEDIESINETETMIEEAFNGEDFYCESSLSSDSSKLENCYIYVKDQGNEDTMIT